MQSFRMAVLQQKVDPAIDLLSKLDCGQLRATLAFRRRKSIAILGGAGSGKSFLLSVIVQDARRRYSSSSAVAVCAMTNLASSIIGGTTLHSLLGAPPYWKFSNEGLWELVRRNKSKMERLRRLEVIIIDEVPILPAIVLDAFDYVMRKLAQSDRLSSIRFGGRQVIFAGDPFQLEPVGMRDGCEETYHAFSSRSWFLLFGGFGGGVISIFKGNQRQDSDERFYSILGRIRYGTATQEDVDLLNRSGNLGNAAGPPKSHTVLCLRRKEVEVMNRQALAAMVGQSFVFEAEDTFVGEETEELISQVRQLALQRIELKIGCQLLLTRKVEELLPGTRVEVERIHMRGSRAHFISVRVADSENLGFTESAHIEPLRFHVYSENATVAAYRKQLPVVPAYAITIHRSQGLSLSKVAVDFSVVQHWIPKGMVYEALSRCRSLDGLWVRGLSLHHIRVSRNALYLMQKLSLLRNRFPLRVIGTPGVERRISAKRAIPVSFEASLKIEKENVEPHSRIKVRKLV